jgi:hypothetical protein
LGSSALQLDKPLWFIPPAPVVAVPAEQKKQVIIAISRYNAVAAFASGIWQKNTYRRMYF